MKENKPICIVIEGRFFNGKLNRSEKIGQLNIQLKSTRNSRILTSTYFQLSNPTNDLLVGRRESGRCS